MDPLVSKSLEITSEDLYDLLGVASSELAVAMRSLGFDSYFLKNGIKNWKGSLVKQVSGEIHSPTFCIRRG
jgi:hypothetical protein